jgi:hypothetical protein
VKYIKITSLVTQVHTALLAPIKGVVPIVTLALIGCNFTER